MNEKIRDVLLVTAGMRVAYMDEYDKISIPNGVAGEAQIGVAISEAVDTFLAKEDRDEPFDLYIEEFIAKEFPRGIK